MTLGRGKAALLAAYSLILSTPPDCAGKTEYVIQHFELSSCPDTTFVLPKSVERDQYDLSSERSHLTSAPSPVCPGFTHYSLRENGVTPGYPGWGLDVRLNRRNVCSLDIAYLDAPNSERSGQFTKAAEVAAELVMFPTSVSPTIPASRTERVRAYADDMRKWCSRTARTATAPCEKLPPAAND